MKQFPTKERGGAAPHPALPAASGGKDALDQLRSKLDQPSGPMVVDRTPASPRPSPRRSGGEGEAPDGRVASGRRTGGGAITQPARLPNAYDLLTQPAARGRTITYGAFGPLIGLSPRFLTPVLMPILNWCRGKGLPPLPIIVVRADSGRPSGPYDQDSIPFETACVFAFDWSSVERPSAAELGQYRRRQIWPVVAPHRSAGQSSASPACLALPAASGCRDALNQSHLSVKA